MYWGPRTSLKKCVAYPVVCDGLDIANVLQGFCGAQGVFPCRYLGLPLGFRKPQKIGVQPLFDSTVSRLKGWRGKLMNKKGRLTLINSVITSITTYFVTIFPTEKGMIKSFNKLRRNFIKTPDEENIGGKCLASCRGSYDTYAMRGTSRR
jgi:hypothetical protein